MKKFLLLIVVLSFNSIIYSQKSDNLKFNDYKEKFVLEYWKVFPLQATQVGYHAYDTMLPVQNDEQRKQVKAFATTHLNNLKNYNYKQLDDNNKIDHRLIQSQLKNIIWSIDTEKQYQWNPTVYNITSSFAYILNEPFDKLSNRLISFNNKLKNVPAYYVAAKQNITNPTPEFKNLAISQINNSIGVFEKDLIDSLAASQLNEKEKIDILANSKKAVAAIKEFTAWLKGLNNHDARSFRLGSELYQQKFNNQVQSSYTAQQLFAAATEHKEYLLQQMEKRANSLWPKYFSNQTKPVDRLALIKKVIDTISTQHVEPANFQKAIEDQLPELIAFVKEKNLLYLDPSKPLKVRREPAYMAGVAGASISAPGPYEKHVSTYYNVGSLEGWSKEKVESYLKEYNNYTLQILNIHEGIPGHYLQLVYSNKVPSIIKSVFRNGSMIEGWAVYSELLMLENGYNNSDEMWLMYYKWNLRTTCNTILDISVHTKNMTREEGLDLLTRQAFQQQTEAEEKWKRVTVSSVQLTSYFNGFYEIMQLRKAYKQKLGSAYTDKKFNEQFLSYGSAPVKYIRDMMLK